MTIISVRQSFKEVSSDGLLTICEQLILNMCLKKVQLSQNGSNTPGWVLIIWSIRGSELPLAYAVR